MTITVKVSAEVAAKLKAVCALKRISVSQYVRDAVEARLKRERPKRSLYDAMVEIGAIGCFEGPSDLSTNPKYLKGFGKWRA